MGVCHNGRLTEDIPHDQIGTFPAYSRQSQQLVKVIRHFPLIFIPKDLHAGADISRLAVT